MKELLTKKTKILEQIYSCDNSLKGSIYEMKRLCGKKNCKCVLKNEPHKSTFLSFNFNGKTKLIPIKKEMIPEVKKRIGNFKKMKAYINELIKINSELLKYEQEDAK